MADIDYKPVDGHPLMAARKCKVCGEVFSPPTENRYLCDKCLYEKEHRSLTRNVICKQCGRTFRGGMRASYCPDCRAERRRETDRRSRERKRVGATRHIGSTDICVDCGKEYIVEGGLQKRCKACAAIHDLAFLRDARCEHARSNREEYDAAKARLKTDSHVCPVCGTAFTAGSSKTKYCSEACKIEARRARQKNADEKRRPRKKSKKESKQ